jgi:hypothetical protein
MTLMTPQLSVPFSNSTPYNRQPRRGFKHSWRAPPFHLHRHKGLAEA